MDEQMIEPCPFCGETELRVAFSHEAGRWDIWEVECEKCCVSKDGELGHVGDEARQSAITCWNRRAAHSVIAGKVAELEEQRSRLLGAISWIEPQFVNSKTRRDELFSRIRFCVADAARACPDALAPHPKARNEEDKV